MGVSIFMMAVFVLGVAVLVYEAYKQYIKYVSAKKGKVYDRQARRKAYIAKRKEKRTAIWHRNTALGYSLGALLCLCIAVIICIYTVSAYNGYKKDITEKAFVTYEGTVKVYEQERFRADGLRSLHVSIFELFDDDQELEFKNGDEWVFLWSDDVDLKSGNYNMKIVYSENSEILLDFEVLGRD